MAPSMIGNLGRGKFVHFEPLRVHKLGALMTFMDNGNELRSGPFYFRVRRDT
jgi:hypothetical protein